MCWLGDLSSIFTCFLFFFFLKFTLPTIFSVYRYMTSFFKLRQQLSTSNSSDTDSNRHRLGSGLLPKLAVSAEHDGAAPQPRELHEEPEKPALPAAESAQEEPEVTTPASTISSSTLSGKAVGWPLPSSIARQVDDCSARSPRPGFRPVLCC